MSEKEGDLAAGNPEDWQQELNQDYSEHRTFFESAEGNLTFWEKQMREYKPEFEAGKDYELTRGFVEDEFKRCWVDNPMRQRELDIYLNALHLSRADLADLPTIFELVAHDPQTQAPELRARLYYRSSQQILNAQNVLDYRQGEGQILQHEYMFPALKLTEMVAERIEIFEPGSAYEQALFYFLDYLKSRSSEFGFRAWQELEGRIREILHQRHH